MRYPRSALEEQLVRLPLRRAAAFRSGKPVAFADGPRLRASTASRVLLPRGVQRSVRGKRVAVMFSGGPAAGGHNVLVGLAHVLKGNTLLGIRGGPGGLMAGNIAPLDVSAIANTGGFDALGTDRTKLKSPEQLARVDDVCAQHKIDALIIIGGDDSNTNAALLAQALPRLIIIGVPKTMDGDVQVDKYLPISFGFDTACRTYGELVGNLCRDALSSRKYWHFVRLMGRDASHVTLEVALQTQPTVTIISEEVRERQCTMHHIVEDIARVVAHRAQSGQEYGVVLVPEGLLEALPEFNTMLKELDALITARKSSLGWRSLRRRRLYLSRALTKASGQLFRSLPEPMQEMLTLPRDSHGNRRISQIPTEQFLAKMVEHRLAHTKTPFRPLTHFFGYEGRCAAPSAFDAFLAYNLGWTAGSLALAGRSGYMAGLTALDKGGVPVGIPLAGLLSVRDGKPVIAKRLVRLQDPAFRRFATHRSAWEQDSFLSPGPLQFWGPASRLLPMTVALNNGYAARRKVR